MHEAHFERQRERDMEGMLQFALVSLEKNI